MQVWPVESHKTLAILIFCNKQGAPSFPSPQTPADEDTARNSAIDIRQSPDLGFGTTLGNSCSAKISAEPSLLCAGAGGLAPALREPTHPCVTREGRNPLSNPISVENQSMTSDNRASWEL